MALVLKDRVKGWTDSYGEDNFVIFATTNGYQSFSVIGNGNQTYYTVFDPTNYDWEVGIGTYTAATTTLSRDTILSSSNNNLIVSFLPGTKELFVGYPAEKAVTLDTPQTLTDKTLVNATVTSGTVNNTTIGATTPASGAFTTLVASGASLTSVNAGVALLTSATVTTLNATGASIASANIGNLQFTAASIASINAGVAVITNLSATSASIASMNAGVALLTTATVTTLNATGASIASANIGNLQFTAASIASINAGVAVITNLTATGASIASANVGTAVITAATVTGASIASANAGTAVITALTVTGASVASANFGNVVTTTERVTNLSVTNASVASINAAVALITTGTVTALTATGASVASANVGTAVVTGLTVTNASIASLNAGTATVTTGNLTFSSTGQRITGDMSNATVANRLMFQTSTANTATIVGVLPSGTGTEGRVTVLNNSDPTVSSGLDLRSLTTEAQIRANNYGGGALPMTFYTGGSERMRLDTSGNLGLGTAGATDKFQIEGTGTVPVASIRSTTTGSVNQAALNLFRGDSTNGFAQFGVGTTSTNTWQFGLRSGSTSWQLFDVSANTARVVVDTSGNVGIGTASPGTRLSVSSATNAGISVTDGTVTTIMYNSTGGVGSIGTTSNHPVDFYANNAARMRIDSSGNVAVGFTGNAGQGIFQVARTISGGGPATSGTTDANQVMVFNASSVQLGYGAYVDGTGWIQQRATGSYATNYALAIQPNGGNVGIGVVPSSGFRLHVKGSGTASGAYACVMRNSADTNLLVVQNDGEFATGTAANSPYNKTTALAANVYVDANGILYRSTSSLRYKSNVTNAAHGLSDVLKLRSVTYKGKNDGDTVFGGLIAEEVHDAGLTEFVAYDKEGRPDALHYGNMVALLVKAVQELSAKVVALEAR